MTPDEVRDACHAVLRREPDGEHLLAVLEELYWDDRDWCDMAAGVGESTGDGCTLEEAVSDFPEYVRETEKMEKEAKHRVLETRHQEARREREAHLRMEAQAAEARQEPLL